MSHFYLKGQPSRRKRVGICLRMRSVTCVDVYDAIRKSRLKRKAEHVWQVRIHEYNRQEFPGKVMLEVWCQSLVDQMKGRHRHNVFHLWVDENENWCCEGDQGRGLV